MTNDLFTTANNHSTFSKTYTFDYFSNKINISYAETNIIISSLRVISCIINNQNVEKHTWRWTKYDFCLICDVFQHRYWNDDSPTNSIIWKRNDFCRYVMFLYILFLFLPSSSKSELKINWLSAIKLIFIA